MLFYHVLLCLFSSYQRINAIKYIIGNAQLLYGAERVKKIEPLISGIRDRKDIH